MQTRRVLPGAPPGTLVADPNAQAPVITAIRYGPAVIEEIGVAGVAQIPMPSPDFAVTWINVDGLGDVETIDAIGEMFGIHDLALEDVINVHQRPKAEDHESYLFVVGQMPDTGEFGSFQTEQVSFFLKEGLLITFQEKTGDCFEPVRNRLREARGQIRGSGSDYLLYALLDTMTDSFFPVLEIYGDQVEALNEAVLRRVEDVSPAEFHHLRRDLMTFRRAIWPLREMFGAVLRDSSPLISETTKFYLRDCYDHAVQLLDFVETYREIAAGSIELYMSGINNRMNEIMKVLTIIATIFIPLSFITGVYGMNFDPSVSPWNMPELKWAFGYPFALGLMVAIAVVLLVFFGRRGWLSQRKDWRD